MMHCPHCGKPLTLRQSDAFEDLWLKAPMEATQLGPPPKAGSIYLPNGSKDYQLSKIPDICGYNECRRKNRSYEFSRWLRNNGIPCFDVDEIVACGPRLCCVFELTRPHEYVFSEDNYLAGVDARRKSNTRGNTNDRVTAELARKLGCPAMLIVFQPNIIETNDTFVWWRDLDGSEWNKKVPVLEFLDKLRGDFKIR